MLDAQERHGLDMAELLAKHPGVRAWMQAVARATAPHYEQVRRSTRLLCCSFLCPWSSR